MSSEKPKIDIDELMALYLDGEVSQRQQTELKRMMLKDPSIALRLTDLQRQRKLLRALPIESAPEGLIDDVMGELERGLILGSADESTQATGTSRFAMNRWSAVAAMVLVPVGLLSMVVWSIVKPANRSGLDYIPAGERVAVAPAPEAPVEPAVEKPLELPFNGTLVLRTDQYMTVSDGVMKAIEAKGLIGEMVPNRTADVTSFSITAAPKKITDLIDAMTDVRGRCKAATLEVTQPGGQVVRITNPKNRQIKTLVFEDNAEMMNRLATRYASANLKPDTLMAKSSDDEKPALTDDGYPAASVPTLAGTYDQPDAKIQLTIHVERSF
ncbi:MAG: anti-sigma factor family protein [Planctomycetota bacterium]|jgi:hypothetical protein